MIFQEVPLPDALIVELDKVLEKLNYNRELCDEQDYNQNLLPEHGLRRVSLKALAEVLSGHDRNVASCDENMLRMPPEFVKESPLVKMFEDLVKDVCEVGDRPYVYHITGKFWYPNNGFMGWHTNNAYPGYRFYCTHAQEENKSFFRYRHPEGGQIETSWDRQGWMGRIFRIDTERPFWHCVYSETNRISMGCNMEVDTSYSKDWEKLGGRA